MPDQIYLRSVRLLCYLLFVPRDKEKQKIAQARWYREVVKKRRAEWLNANGPCIKCGSWIDLQVDHKDRTQKVSHNVWSWSKEKREIELAKCQPLCKECHLKKTISELYPERKHGTRIMYHAGCRCQPCRDDAAAEKAEWRAKYGRH